MTISPVPLASPLSAAQRSIADAQLLDPDSDVFVVADRVEIVGDVSVPLLAEAIAATVRETETLAFRVVVDDGGVPARIDAAPVVRVAVHDVSGDANPESAAEALVAAELADGAGGFAADRPIGQLVVRLAADRVWWVQRYHHVAVDGYAISLISQRVADRYRVLAGASALGAGFGALTELLADEAAHASSDAGAEDRARVAALLDAVPTAIGTDGSVPTVSGRTAPAVRRAIGVELSLPATVASAVGDLVATDRRVTWADAHTAAFAAFTARAAGVRALVLGVPFAARTSRTAATTPSMSVTVLPLPVRIDPAETLAELSLRLARGLSVLRRAQRARGEAVAEARGVPSLLRGPGINLKPYAPVLDFAGAQGLLRTETAGPVDDLDLSITPHGAGSVRARLDANPDTYTPDELAALAARFEGFWAALAADPSAPLGRIATLPFSDVPFSDVPISDMPTRDVPIDGGQIDAPGVAADEPRPDAGLDPVDVSRVLESVALAHPDDIAVRAGDDAVTFAELHRRVRALAAVLVARGAGPERVVALALPRGIDLVVAIFAVLDAGAALTPIDLAYPADRIAYLLEDADPHVVLAAPGTPAAEHPRAIILTAGETGRLADAPAADPRPFASASLAYVVYTSGSTGRPKGVAVSRGSLTFFLAHHSATLFRHAADRAGRRLRAAHTASFAFDSSWEQLLWLLLGHELVVFDEDDRKDAREIVEAVDRLRLDTLDVTPTFAAALVEAGLLETAHVPALLLIGGEAAPAELWQRIAAAEVPGYNFYGPTEATVDALGAPVVGDLPSIGRPLEGTFALVLDIALQPVPAAVDGELYLAGPHLARGYRGRPGLTAARFVADPRGGGGLVYRTGDVVRIEADGSLSSRGRSDDQAKIRGHRVEPGELRAALAALPGVGQAEAIVRGTGPAVRLLAYAVPTGAAQLDALLLSAALREVLPDHLVPHGLVVLDALPLTAHGKLDAAALPEPSRTAHRGAAASTPREYAVCAAIGEVLGLDDVPADADVIMLGGDSISAIAIVARLRAAGWIARPRDLFAARTAQALAPLLRPLDEAPMRQQIAASGPVPLPPIVRSLRALAPSLDAVRGYAQSVVLDAQNADAAAVRTALDALALRHSVLGLTITVDDHGQWRADIPAGPVRLDLADGDDIERLRARLVTELDPATGRMLAVGWVGDERALVLVAHHLVVDGVSWRVLIDELATLLDGGALATGSESAWRERALALDAEVRSDVSGGAVAVAHALGAARPDAETDEQRHWRQLADQTCAVFPHAIDAGTLGHAVQVVRRADAATAAAVLNTLPLLLSARPDTVLAGALAVALQEWRSAQGRLLVEWETHGRDPLIDGEDTADGVGWFTTEFPVAITLPNPAGSVGERLAEAIRAARQGRAEAPRDGYGADGVVPRARPAVLLNYLGRFDADGDERRRAAALRGDRPFAVHMPDALGLGHAIEIAVFVAPGDAGLDVEWTVAPALAEELPALLAAWDRALAGLAPLARANTAPATLIPADAALARVSMRTIHEIETARGPLRDIAPLSPLQEGLLFHALRDGDDDVYTTATIVPLSTVPHADGRQDPIDTDRVAAAVRAVVAAHPQLGAAFIADLAERPVQLIPRAATLSITVHDLSAVPAAERDLRVQQLADAELAHRTDVARPPLVRAHVIRTGTSTAVLVLAAHHLVIDGWSTPLLISRVIDAAAGESVPDGWPDLRRALTAAASRDVTEARAAWGNHLAGVDAPTLLAVGAGGTVVSRSLDVSLAEADGERLLGVIRAAGLTVGTVLTGAWAHVVGRALGRADVVVGTTTAGRSAAVEGLDRVIGLLSTTVPVRVRLRPDVPLTAQLAALQQERVELQDHEGLPLADIEALAGVGSLFDSLVVVENYPGGFTERPGGLRVGEVRAAGGTHYALGITVLPGAGLRIVLDHDASRIPDDRAVALAAELAAVLARLAEGLHPTPLALPAPADALTLVGVEPLRTPHDGTGSSAVLRSFAAAVRAAPAAIAVRLRDSSFTMAEIDGLAGGLQRVLESQGAGPETLVAIALPRGVETITTILATLATGAAYLPLDLAAPAERTRLVLDDARPSLVVAEARSAVAAAAIAAGIPVIDPFALDDMLDDAAPQPLSPRPAPGNAAAYVIFTSGSTGRPKGVVITRDALDTHFDGLRTGRHAELVRRLRVAEGRERIVAVHSASFSFDTSLIQLHWLFAGHELILLDEDERRDPELFAARARTADVIDVAPVLAEQLLAEGLFDGDRPLPEVFLGGEAVSPALWTALRERADRTRTLNLYGPTETTVDALGAIVADSALPLIGTPVAGVTATVLDDWLRAVPRGVAGELYLEGGQLARGYLDRPGLTAARFIAAPGGARRYRTGDLVRVDADGSTDYLGRLDDQVKIGGNRIELGEVEEALRALDSVAQAAATTDANGSVGSHLLAAITPLPGHELHPHALRAALAERLPAALVPSRIVVIGELPVSTSGKVDRAAVRALALAADGFGGDDRPVTPPSTPEEHLLVRAVSAVLGGMTVSVDDDFFTIGGHSLTALRVLGALRPEGYALSVRDVLDGRILGRIAARMRPIEVPGTGPTGAGAAPAAQAPPVPTVGDVPVSAAQRRLLFLAELEGPSASYTVPVAVDLHGDVPVAALVAGWAALVVRHPVLRTRYHRADGRFTAEALANPPASFAIVELDAGSTDAQLDAAVAAEESRVFDVFAAPPVRATIIRAGERSVFVIAAHHAAVDETSFAVLFDELSSLIAGRHLPDVVPFAAFAIAEAEAVAHGDGPDADLVERWRDRLRGIPAELELPTDRPRPERASYRAETVTEVVPAALARRIARFAAEAGATPLMVVQTAMAALLRALGAGDDIVLGTPVTTRADHRLARTVGYLVNTLPVRIDVSGGAGFAELVERTRQSVLDALDDAVLPFEAIVDAVAPPRSLARHPLFQVMVTADAPTAEVLVLPGVTVVERDGLVDSARFDLSVRYRDGGPDAPGALTLVAAADLFDAASARVLVERLGVWLERLLEDPQRAVRSVDARLDDERGRVLTAASAARVAAAPVPLLEALALRALEDPAALAVRAADGDLDYAALVRQVAGLAVHLRERGIGVDDRVAVAVGRSSALIVALLGVLAVGAAYVPLDVDYPEARLQLMLDDADPVLVLVDDSTRGAGRGRSELVVGSVASGRIAEPGGVTAAAAVLRSASAVPASAAAYVIYTSGSTGRPKGVVIPRAALDAFLEHERGVLALTAADRLLAVTTISFDIAALELFVPLTSGAGIVLADRADVRDPDRLAPLAARTGVTVLQATPSLWRPLLEQHPHAWSGIAALVGGEALPGDLASALGTACRSVRNVYGPTELTVWATSARIDAADAAAIAPGAAAPIGLPFDGVGAAVLDDALRPVPDGVAGELYLSGGQLARGYHARPDLTATRFVADPSGRAGERMYRTGDLVRRGADGVLRFLRRTDDQVKVNGHRMELGEVESALRSLDGVHRAAAIVRPDAQGRGRLLGYVVPAAEVVLDAAAVREAVAALVPGPLVPQLVTVLDDLPLTLNGKVDRGALPEPAIVTVVGRAAEGAAEQAIVAAVAETLGLAEVSPDDAFFELGGDSISSIRLVALVRTRGFVITPGLVFAHERLAALAAAATPLDAKSPDEASSTPAGEPPPRRTRARIGAHDLGSIERLLENTH